MNRGRKRTPACEWKKWGEAADQERINPDDHVAYPDDPVAGASIQRVASTFFNAIDKKEGSPYVFHRGEESIAKPYNSLEPSEPGDDSDQEVLDIFISVIEDAADEAWAAEKEEFGRIRKPEPYRYDDAKTEIVDEGRGRRDANTRRRTADSENEDYSEGINGLENDDGDEIILFTYPKYDFRCYFKLEWRLITDHTFTL
ncbi:hypothetical protein Ancab_002729 [Ancistrocladus abbreviatus]